MRPTGDRRVLVVEYDVTDLTNAQVDLLTMEAVAQSEASDDDAGHPSVYCETRVIARDAAGDEKVIDGGTTQWRATKITVDASVYRSNHGAMPRGRGSWAFVMGKRDYFSIDDLDEHGRKRVWFAPGSTTFGEAKKLAIAEARTRGVTLIGVAP